MKRKRNSKERPRRAPSCQWCAGIAAALAVIAVIAAILLTGGNEPPDSGIQLETDTPSASPGVVVVPPSTPPASPSPGDAVNSPEPNGGNTDDDRPADLIVDVDGGTDTDTDNGNGTATPTVQPDAKPLEPIQPEPSATKPPNLPADDHHHNSGGTPAQEQPSALPAEPPEKPLEPVMPDEPVGGGAVPEDETPEPYHCDTKNHHCDTPEKHAYIANLEIEACPRCGSHACPSFYALNEWGYTQYTPSQCPNYNVSQDPVYTCQDCGKPTGDGTGGTCVSFVNDTLCPNCGKTVPARTCHSCD